ncbi:MAG: hypothetical protein L6247_09030 [Desulfobacteraceae bacterium]|nr:hypothetical protein [Desulfobacteraceae bacterium]
MKPVTRYLVRWSSCGADNLAEMAVEIRIARSEAAVIKRDMMDAGNARISLPVINFHS